MEPDILYFAKSSTLRTKQDSENPQKPEPFEYDIFTCEYITPRTRELRTVIANTEKGLIREMLYDYLLITRLKTIDKGINMKVLPSPRKSRNRTWIYQRQIEVASMPRGHTIGVGTSYEGEERGYTKQECKRIEQRLNLKVRIKNR